jgi:thiol-disulfide isomerase/thioredoxin
MLKSFIKIIIAACCVFCLLSTTVAGASELALADMDGNEHRLSDYRGKWVLVNYWATWCGPCVEEIPKLQNFYQANKAAGVVVIGVNFEDIGVEALRTFVRQQNISFPVWLASPDEPSPWGRIRGVPTSFIISPKGDLLHTFRGQVDLKKTAEIIAEAGK